MHVGLRQADGGDRIDTRRCVDFVGTCSDGVLDISKGDEYFAGGAAYMPGVAAGDTHISLDGAGSHASVSQSVRGISFIPRLSRGRDGVVQPNRGDRFATTRHPAPRSDEPDSPSCV